LAQTPDRVEPRAPRHLVVIANPSPTSFDHSIVDAYREIAAENRQKVEVRDLYGLRFDPALKADERPMEDGWQPAPDVAIELEHLRLADILVLVYPIWFGLPPAMLKGYVDRVLGAGYTFRDIRSRLGQPVVAGKPLLSFTTSGLALPWLHEQGQVLALREIFDAYLWQGLGMSQAEHVRVDSVVPDMSPHYAAEQLERVRDVARKTCAMLRAAQDGEKL
jgi:NAD(P)H dehydrogenase (quinone)